MPIAEIEKILELRPKGRLLGLDHGTKKIGVAVCDPGQSIASALTILRPKNFTQAAREIDSLMQEYEAVGIILGWPLETDGKIGKRCQSVRDFAHNLASKQDLFPKDLWIALQDERLSTDHVEKFLVKSVDMSRAKRAKVEDALAAQYILQSAIDCF